MPLHYRDNDTVSGRWTGNTFADLSRQQLDENVYLLKAQIDAVQASVTSSRSIDHVTISGNELTFYMTDSTLEGPFAIPVAAFRSRGAFSAPTAYSVNDTFYINGTVYLVLYPHTSASPFDAGANDGLGHSYYAEMVPNPGNALPTGGAVGMKLTKTTTSDFACTWAYETAVLVTFSPSTASGLTSTNVAAALEELETLVHTLIAAEVDHAQDVTFTPSTASTLTSTNVADALDELGVDVSNRLPLAGGTMSGAIVLAADPAGALQAATKQYVDGIAANLGKRARVRAATTANITISTALNNGDTLDGVTLSTGDQVLVKDQSTTNQNGIYIVGVTPVRADQFDTYDEHPGSLIAVEEGSVNNDTLWLCTSNVGGTLNTTAIAFSAITSGSSYSAGSGIDLTGSTFSLTANAQIDVIEFVIDGGGSTITTGMKGYIEVPFACTITRATLLADQSGSIVVDVFKCTYAQFDAGSTHPVSGDKITASAPPTISSATKAQDSTLSGWTTSVSAGDILAFNVNSVTTIQRVTISLKVTHV